MLSKTISIPAHDEEMIILNIKSISLYCHHTVSVVLVDLIGAIKFYPKIETKKSLKLKNKKSPVFISIVQSHTIAN